MIITTKPFQVTALLVLCGLSISQVKAQGTLKVFLLAGQSNMEGQAYTYDSVETAGWNIPTMEFLLSGSPAASTYLANVPHNFKGSLNATWLNPRPDVWCVHYNSENGLMKEVQPTSDPLDNFVGFGPLSPGFGVGFQVGKVNSRSMFGAELGMGIRIGDATTDPVFLFKSDKGGTTLAEGWRPPSAVAARGGVVGPHFTRTVNLFSQFLDNLDADLMGDGVLNNSIGLPGGPMFGEATGYEVCGFVWLQGFNEKVENGGNFIPEYEENLVDLIHDIRSSDPRIPADLPYIVIESSDQHATMNTARVNAVATVNAEIPGSAVFHHTENMINGNPGPVFWGNNDLGAPFSTEWGFHFHARAENFLEIGWIAGGAVLDNDYLTSSSFWVKRPEVTSVAFNEAGASASINAAADTVTMYWGTSDPGPSPSGWNGGNKNLGAQAAGEIMTTLTGLSEDTTYFFRVHATNTALGTDFWSAPNTFTTPLEFPVPEMAEPLVTGVVPGGAAVEGTLLLADADVTLVWAREDKGETDIPTWSTAPGGGAQAFPGRSQDDLIVHDIMGLDSNTTYFIRFYATNANGHDWSGPESFQTPRDVASLTVYYDFEDDGDPFNDPAGDFADDLTGRHDPDGIGLSSDTPGTFAGTGAAEFNGNVAYFTGAYTDDLGPDPNAYTIMFWIKGDDDVQENNNIRLMTSRVGASVNMWQVEGIGNGKDGPDVRIQGSMGNFITQAASGSLPPVSPLEWHHVTFVLANSGHPDDGGAYARTFVDGVQVGEITNPDSRYDFATLGNLDGRLVVGSDNTSGGSRAFSGLLDEVALFAGVVEDADIAAIAAGTMSPADFLPAAEIVITRVETVGTNVEIDFAGEAGVAYKLTESADLKGGFSDTSPLVETTSDASGKGTVRWPLAGARKFGRVETK